VMASELKTDFGQLYRRAFAEKDPVIKKVLLREVQAHLDEWRENSLGIASRSDAARSAPDLQEALKYPLTRRA